MSDKKNCGCTPLTTHPLTEASTDAAGPSAALSRRGFLKRAGISGLAAAAAPFAGANKASAASADGTP